MHAFLFSLIAVGAACFALGAITVLVIATRDESFQVDGYGRDWNQDRQTQESPEVVILQAENTGIRDGLTRELQATSGVTSAQQKQARHHLLGV